MSKPDIPIEPVFDKKEAVTEIKMTTKWNLKFSCSENSYTFSEVRKRNCYGGWNRPTFSALNQLLSGHYSEQPLGKV